MANKVLALVPLRGGSKSIPKKNIKLLAGKSLCAWVLEAAYCAKMFDEIVVSTDSEEIANVIRSLNMKIKIIERPPHLATDMATTESVMLHLAEKVHFETLVTIQATSPLTTPSDLVNAYQKFQKEGYDSLLTGVRLKRFLWNENGTPINYDPFNRPMRQNYKGVIMENGAFYITKREILEHYKCRLGGKIGIYVMPDDAAVEIDEPGDWKLVERILIKRRKKEILPLLKDVRLVAMDCDGVLTDAGMYYGNCGEELKKFNTRDGHGIEMLRKKGIKIAIITGEKSKLVQNRAKKLNVDDLFMGVKEKVEPLELLLKKYNLSQRNVLYIGDDINDLSIIKKVGVSFAVADALECVKKEVDFITEASGGRGAVREVCELILESLNES